MMLFQRFLLLLIFFIVSSFSLRFKRTRDSSVSVPSSDSISPTSSSTQTLHCFGPEFGTDAMDNTNCIKMGGEDGDTLKGAIEKIGNMLAVEGRNEGIQSFRYTNFSSFQHTIIPLHSLFELSTHNNH